MERKVLIVGAGPTGLTVATELARLGVAPTIIDKRDAASTLSRAVGITPRSLQLLSHSGIAERLIAQGTAMTSVQIYRGEKLALAMALHSERAYYPTILGLPQDETETIMAEVLDSRGTTVQYGVALESFDEREHDVVAQFSNGSEERFDYVVGADGVNSTVRQSAGIEFPGFDLDETWSIADVHADNWQHADALTLIQAGPGVVMVVAPIGASRYRVVASHENALQILPLPLDVKTINREGTFKISVRQAKSYSKGRIHLAGDAAHCHSPVGGRGMNLGIADAAELASCIVNEKLGEYSSLRHKEGADAIAVTERGRKIVSGLTWPRRLLFRSALTAASHVAPMRRNMGRFMVEF